MKHPNHFLVQTYILIQTATWCACWQYFTPLNELELVHPESRHEEIQIHSEYQFGMCASKEKIFYTHVHLDRMDVMGKIIIRGWIKVMRIPTCIVVRGLSYEIDQVQSTTYKFQICVPRITYCHSHRRFKLHYYEWYIPYDMSGGMDWDIYFFGPASQSWGGTPGLEF